MALILAFDTATPHLAVVLARDGRVVAGRIGAGDRTSHAAALNVLVQEVLQEAGSTLRALDAVAVGIGPGSYTGLRIGLSAAKGFCFPLGTPLIGLPTLEVLGHQLAASGSALRPDDRLHPMVDARRMEVFTTTLDGELRLMTATAPAILDAAWCNALEGSGRQVVFGEGADKAVALWKDAGSKVLHVPGIAPSLDGLAAIAEVYHAQGRTSDLAYLVPEYGKAANVTQAKAKG